MDRPGRSSTQAAAMGGPELLDARVAQLATGTEPLLSTIGLGAVIGTVGGAMALTGLFVAAIAVGPSGIAGVTAPDVAPLVIAGAFACAAPWAVAIWLGYRWLGHRTRRPL